MCLRVFVRIGKKRHGYPPVHLFVLKKYNPYRITAIIIINSYKKVLPIVRKKYKFMISDW